MFTWKGRHLVLVLFTSDIDDTTSFITGKEFDQVIFQLDVILFS